MYPQKTESLKILSTGVRDLKNNLSRYLTSVKSGNTVLITQHGRPIARIVEEPSKKRGLRDQLAPLVAKGLIDFPVKNLKRHFKEPPQGKGESLSSWIIEDRR